MSLAGPENRRRPEGRTRRRWRAGLGAGLVVLAATLVLTTGPAEPPARAEADSSTPKCAGASKQVRKLSGSEIERATVCVVGVERKQRGLEPGALEERLDDAADGHAERMIRKDCFSHRCPGEPELEERLRRAGYLDEASDWSFAENIGCATTVEAMVKAWHKERSSRRNMFGEGFRDLGVGFTKKVPRRCDGPPKAGTFTLVLGVAER